MCDIVGEWYETKSHVDEMVHWQKASLKKWELTVTGYFPARARILDIGCGLGREAFALSDMGFSVAGIDISREVITQAVKLSAQKGYGIPFSRYDGHTLPFGDGSFDAVVIWSQTFGLLYGDEYKRGMLSECGRVLTDGGLLSFSGHDYAFETENYKRYLSGRKFYPYADTGLYWETFERDELIGFAKDAGFTVMLCEKGEIYREEDGTILHCLCRK